MGVGYVPHDDDRPEGAPSAPTELTLAQQLLLKQYEEQVQRMSTKECQDLALEIARQMMVKVGQVILSVPLISSLIEALIRNSIGKQRQFLLFSLHGRNYTNAWYVLLAVGLLCNVHSLTFAFAWMTLGYSFSYGQDNILRTMLKKEVDFGAEPPDPAEFEGTEGSGKK